MDYLWLFKSHPTRAELRAFAADATDERVASHLEACSPCEDRVLWLLEKAPETPGSPKAVVANLARERLKKKRR